MNRKEIVVRVISLLGFSRLVALKSVIAIYTFSTGIKEISYISKFILDFITQMLDKIGRKIISEKSVYIVSYPFLFYPIPLQESASGYQFQFFKLKKTKEDSHEVQEKLKQTGTQKYYSIL